MTGSSTPSGRLRPVRLSASRTSEVATSRLVPSVNSSVTRLRPVDELDEIEDTPCTRATAPSMIAVTSRSTVSAAAPLNSVDIDNTGCSTLGSSRTSAPSSAARPATTISALTTAASIGRRTKSDASVPPRSFFWAMDMAGAPRDSGLGDGRFGSAIRTTEQGHPGAIAQLQYAFGYDGVAGRKIGPDQNAIAVALHDFGGYADRLAVNIFPHI